MSEIAATKLRYWHDDIHISIFQDGVSTSEAM
jgi:hypothetical protein